MTDKEREQERTITELRERNHLLEQEVKCLRQELSYITEVKGKGSTLNTSSVDKCIKDCISIFCNSKEMTGISYLQIASWLTDFKALKEFVDELKRRR